MAAAGRARLTSAKNRTRMKQREVRLVRFMYRVSLKPWRFYRSRMRPARRDLFNEEVDFVAGVKFRIVIRHHNTNFQTMLARVDACQRPLGGVEHSRHLAIDIRVHMFAALAFGQLEMQWSFVTQTINFSRAPPLLKSSRPAS